MGELLIFNERTVKAKGLNRENKVNWEKVKSYFFKDDFENLKFLEPVKKFDLQKGRLFYPGCGSDILTPLIYLEKLFPSLKEVLMVLLDENNFENSIKTVLDEVGVNFDEKMNFYW